MKHFLLLCILLCLAPLSLSHAQYNAVNSVLSLNGASYVSVPYSSALNTDLISSGAVSISAWVRPTAGGSVMTIVGNDVAQGYWFGLNAQGKLRYYPNPSVSFEGTAAIPANTWTHVAVSFDAFKNNLRFYINGALDRQINTGQTYLGFNYFDLRIGADRQVGGPSLYWTGMIDEVRIWATDIDFSSAEGLLYKIPLAMTGGRYGRYIKGGWRFNGNAISIDGSVNGSAVGTVLYPASPDPAHYDRIGLQVTNGPDLGDHVTVKHANALTLTQTFTLECWVKPASTGGHAQYQTFISKGAYAQSVWNYWLGLNKSNNKVRFLPTGNWSAPLESSTAIPLNAWTHVAARFEPEGKNYRATIFLNGLPAGSSTYAQPGTGTTWDLLLGCSDTRSTGQTAYGYSGTLDEVRLWNVARTDAEIADHHRMEFNGPMTGLVACYRLDGDDLDMSGNGYDGTGSFRTSSFAYFVSTTSLPSEPTLTLTRPVGGERWAISHVEQIRWTAQGLINVRLELSRDGGQTFGEVLAPSVPASPGVFNWTVTAPPTTNAVVRVRPPTTTVLLDRSKAFEIEDPVPVLYVQPRQIVFTASENGPLPPAQSIQFLNTGGSVLSWTAQASSAQWYDLSANAGTGNQDSVQVQVNTTNLPVGSYSDNIIVGGNAVNAPLTVNVTLRIIPLVSYSISGTVKDGAGIPVEGVKVIASGVGDRSTFTDANGDYEVPGLVGGNYSVTPVSPYFSFTPTFRAVQGLASNTTGIDFVASGRTGDVVIRYEAGWNLISLPLQPAQNAVSSLFPATDGKAYEYVPSQGYVEVNALEYGKGYWLKFPTRDSVVVNGALLNTLDYQAQDQFGGWNLMGAPSGPAALSGIVQNPSGALVVVYGYDPALGYFIPADGMLRPGQAYFIKVNTSALLHIVTSGFTAFPASGWMTK
ncbi:MAG: carboxypeptidase regulatory-like domain-containing protein [Bacteroidetes bacterium]|nr:carboxypeptidase regulatory-like domain-containing protein [Bacteroidota bacterium]